MADLVKIDGSRGEGGGQVLRSSLALSMITGRPLQLERVRARRKKPGLRLQHLTAVKAAAAVSGAACRGARLGSDQVRFEPGAVQGRDYRFAVGSAGSACLVLQTVLPALLTADAPSTVTVEGGTHNSMAPPFDFLAEAFVPLLGRMGASVNLELERHGFYPAGGGRLRAEVAPCPSLSPLRLLERGAAGEHSARALLANLPKHVAKRELRVVARELGWPRERLEMLQVESPGPGNALLLRLEFENVIEVTCAFGQKGVPAERVAGAAVAEARQYLQADAPVGEHLADQLLLPMAMAGGGAFRTLPLSGHTRTNMEVISRFLEVRFRQEEQDDGTMVVEVA